MSKRQDEPELSALELLRIASMKEAARLAGVSERTLRRNYADRILQVSERRQGMRVGVALQIKSA